MTATIEEQQARLDRYRGFLSADPENETLAGEVADLSLQLGLCDQAREVITTALREHPGHPLLLAKLANAAICSNQPTEAIDIYRRLIETGHDGPANSYGLAYALMLEHRFTEAHDLILPIVANELAPEAPVLLARCLHHLGRQNAAREHLTTFLAAHPQHSDALGTLALLQLDSENNDAALTAAEQALQINSHDLLALITLGSLALSAQNAKTANGYFDLALEHHPHSGRAWYGKGMATLLTFDMNQAAEYLQRALEYMPNHVGSWNALAWCQILAGKLEEASHNFEQSMKLEPDSSDAPSGLALIASLQGRKEAADSLLQQAKRLEPEAFAARTVPTQGLDRNEMARLKPLLHNLLANPDQANMDNLQETVSRIVKMISKNPGSYNRFR